MKRRKHHRSTNNARGTASPRFGLAHATAPIVHSGESLHTPARRGSSFSIWIRGAAIGAAILAFGAAVGAGIHGATCATERGQRSIQCKPEQWGTAPHIGPQAGVRDTSKPAQAPTYPAASKSARRTDYRYLIGR